MSENNKKPDSTASGATGKQGDELYALFGHGPNTQLNACVGNNGGPYDFSDYGQGFFDGGTKIVEALKRNDGLIDVLGSGLTT